MAISGHANFDYTLLLAEVFFCDMVLSIYELFHFLPPITGKKIKTVVAIATIPFYSHLTSSWLLRHITLAWENGDGSSL